MAGLSPREQRMLDLIRREKVGAAQIAQLFKVSIQAVYAKLSVIRRKGYRVYVVGDHYFLEDEPSSAVQVPAPASAPVAGAITPQAVERAQRLDSEAREQFLDQMRRSIIHQRTAMAIVDANDIVSSVRAQLEEGGHA